ncbi:MAG TPA: hypothetical protein VII95_03565 [Terriglobales bacterium]|jgi:hypothetical protein
MSDGTAENDTSEMGYEIDVELSDRELLSIGKIVALWGSLEYEIFCQTLMCFGDMPHSQLPEEMNNMHFSQVLALWETHVVNNAVGKRKEVLQEQYKSIRHYDDFRNALVHGMWNWSKAAPEKITATRIRKKEVRSTHFTADDLASFASVLATINFQIRYPGGREEYAKAMAEQGPYMSRRGFCLMTSNPLTDDLFPSFLPKAQEALKK